MAKIDKQTTASLLANRSRLVTAAPSLEGIIRGTLLRYRLTCGNTSCRCRRLPRQRHGPYWYVAVSYGKGCQKRYLLPAAEVPRAKRGIAAYKKLWESLCRISEINLALIRKGR